MPNYDFNILQPAEFEDFSRDILQAREYLFIESFTDGRDGGIDCRFAYDKTKTAVVQCKRYKSWSQLYAKLKQEIEKVKKINPNRYILTTSVGLTPRNKEHIKSLFKPFIVSYEDILGESDLNNLLGLYPNIETAHYKLWLSSSNILTHILHQDIIGWSQMAYEEIKTDLCKYVQNKSFHDAIEILRHNHFVIISGVPGIGKTTLARMLVLYHIEREGFEIFTDVTYDLKEAIAVAENSKKQIIFFDDFLGKNFLEDRCAAFFRQIGTFLASVKSNPDKILIITTREYIFQEAKSKYDRALFGMLEGDKYILEMDNYTSYIRAQIIYNHFASAELPVEYAEKLRGKLPL